MLTQLHAVSEKASLRLSRDLSLTALDVLLAAGLGKTRATQETEQYKKHRDSAHAARDSNINSESDTFKQRLATQNPVLVGALQAEIADAILRKFRSVNHRQVRR